MHDTARDHARLFFELYWRPEFTDVVDLGSLDVNGSLREVCPPGARYVGVDAAPGKGVDVVVAPGDPLPFPDAVFDVALTSSCFEHDVCFWESFVELIRVLKPGGLLYVNVPSNHGFHRYPVDCWRFYPDAGLALVQWAMKRGYPAELLESFVAPPKNEAWADFVAVFRRASAQPCIRRGRMADRTPADNVHDFERPGIERETGWMYDMRVMLDQSARIAALEKELAECRRATPLPDVTPS